MKTLLGEKITIVVFFFVFPLIVVGGMKMAIWLICLCIWLCFVKNFKVAPSLLMVIFCCLPGGMGDAEIVSVSLLKSIILYNVLYLMPIVTFIVVRKNNKNYDNKILFWGFLLLLVGLIYSLIYSDRQEFFYVFSFVLICTCSYYLNIYNQMNLKAYMDLFDYIFLCIFIYAILDTFHRTPYEVIYSDPNQNIMYLLEFSFRSKSLLGHPLYLSGVSLFYQVLLLIRYIYYKKFSWIKEFICIICILLSVSRTPIVILLVIVILYILLFRLYKNFSRVFGAFVVVLLFILLLGLLGLNYVDMIVNRFDVGSIEHRLGAFQTTMNVLEQFPLGTGNSNLLDYIEKYHLGGQGYSETFKTMDNFYLTMLSAYSIFSISIFVFLFYFLYRAFKIRQFDEKKGNSIILLYSIIIFLGFSFNWNGSYALCYFLFGMIGILLKTPKELEC